MAGNDDTGEFRVAWGGGMMRRQCLRPGKQNDKQENESPSRGDHTPSSGMPIAMRLGFGSDTFQHAITRLLHCSK
jgi:hypothetical protein